MLERARELGLEVPAGRQLLRLAVDVDDGRLPEVFQASSSAISAHCMSCSGVRPCAGYMATPIESRTLACWPPAATRLRRGAQDLVGREQRVAFVAQVREHEDELAVAETREVVAGLRHLREPVPELVEHARRVHVAGAREQPLELVNVDDQHRDAVELRLARSEPRAHGLEAVGVAAGRGGACMRCVHGVN